MIDGTVFPWDLGVLVPPSILLVVYGLLTQSPIGQLFIAALVAEVLEVLFCAGAIMIKVRLDPKLAPRAERTEWRGHFRLIGRVWQVLVLFRIVIGGIYRGWFSPIGAAAAGALGTFALALISGRLNRQTLKASVQETAGLTGMIFFTLIGTVQMRQAPPSGDREPGLGPVERSKPAADLRCGHAELIRQQFSKTQW